MASQSAPRRSDAASILSVGQPPSAPPSPSGTTQRGSNFFAAAAAAPPRPSLEAQSAAMREANLAKRASVNVSAAEFAEKLSAAAQDKKNAGYLRMMPRKWATGDVYAPHDLSEAEMRKAKKNRRQPDVIDLYGIKPMDMYRNFNFLAHFMTPGGQIQHSNLTQLRPVNQRKVARAIRRAIGLGLMPSVHRHPEILKHEFQLESNHRAFQIFQKTRVSR